MTLKTVFLLCCALFLPHVVQGAAGPHDATYPLNGVRFSEDRTRMLAFDVKGYSLWDTKTGQLLSAKSYAEMGMPTPIGSQDDVAERDLRYLFVESRSSDSYLVDLVNGTAKKFPAPRLFFTYNGKGRSFQGAGAIGYDLATGKTIPLTEAEQMGRPLRGGSGLIYYSKGGTKNFIFDPKTGKTRRATAAESKAMASDSEDVIVAGLNVRMSANEPTICVLKDTKWVEAARFKLTHRWRDSGSGGLAALPTPEPAILVWETKHDFRTQPFVYQNFANAYSIPDGKPIYSIVLNATAGESAAEGAAEQKRKDAYYAALREKERIALANAPAKIPGAVNIGDRRGGGVVFYVDATGQHGLIIDIGESIGAQPYPANAERTAAVDKDGFSNWYVPSLEEWRLVYAARRPLEAALSRDARQLARQDYEYYWSSTPVQYYGSRGSVVANRWRYHPTANNEAEATVSTDLCIVRLIRSF